MKTIEEAAKYLGRTLSPDEQSARDETMRQLMQDPALLTLTMVFADAPGGGVYKILFALAYGVLLGMESEK
jgi:hypothetical protein